MVGDQMATDDSDDLLVGFPPSHEPALAPDYLRHEASNSAWRPRLLPECWHDRGIATAGAHSDLWTARNRAGWRARRVPIARPPGPTAAHLPGCESSSSRGSR